MMRKLSMQAVLRHLALTLCLLLPGLSLGAVVKTGIEVLRERNFDLLEGKRVGLVTNPSGVDRLLKSTIDILREAPNVNLVALYGPEHGVRGDVWAGGKIEDSVDKHSGLPVFSLYGATRNPTPQMLQGIDVMVYDIQDVGTRSYTFISTLGLVMRACGQLGIEVVVLDRPNPLSGLKVEGCCVREGFFSFVSQYEIPYLYGLTVGELAVLINEEGLNCDQKGDRPHVKCALTVVPMEGWRREMLYADTGLPWVLPSPNIPTAEAAKNYPASGLCGELYGYVQVGIGYTLPFGVFAAEWIDADALKARLDSYALPGTSFRTIQYKPMSGSSAGKLIYGVQFFFPDYQAACVTLTQFYVMQALAELYPGNKAFAPSRKVGLFDKCCGTDQVRLLFGQRHRVEDIEALWMGDAEAFRRASSRYWLYR